MTDTQTGQYYKDWLWSHKKKSELELYTNSFFADMVAAGLISYLLLLIPVNNQHKALFLKWVCNFYINVEMNFSERPKFYVLYMCTFIFMYIYIL